MNATKRLNAKMACIVLKLGWKDDKKLMLVLKGELLKGLLIFLGKDSEEEYNLMAANYYVITLKLIEVNYPFFFVLIWLFS